MQKRHQDRQCYFNELANTSRSFYINYVKQFISLSSSTHILEIGCGEGGNLLPFAELDCKVTGTILLRRLRLQRRIQDDGFLQLLFSFPLPAHPDTRCH